MLDVREVKPYGSTRWRNVNETKRVEQKQGVDWKNKEQTNKIGTKMDEDEGKTEAKHLSGQTLQHGFTWKRSLAPPHTTHIHTLTPNRDENKSREDRLRLTYFGQTVLGMGSISPMSPATIFGQVFPPISDRHRASGV